MFVYLKLLYLYLTYWLVGLTEEGFQYKKAWYLTELGNYHAAIRALQKTEKYLKTTYVYSLLGWCYMQLEAYDNSLKNYKLAIEKGESPDVLLGLAFAEYYTGNTEKSKEYYQRLEANAVTPEIEQAMEKLQFEYANGKNSLNKRGRPLADSGQ